MTTPDEQLSLVIQKPRGWTAPWQSPEPGTEPTPEWYSNSDGYQPEFSPTEPAIPICSKECPWFVSRAQVRELLKRRGIPGPSIVSYSLCGNPKVSLPHVDDLTGYCWPAYNDIWRRAFASSEDSP